MKPSPFAYHRPTTVAEAVAVLAEVGPRGNVLAGGQSLVPRLNSRLIEPAHIVDINAIAALSYIRQDVDPVRGHVMRVGALTRHAQVERDSAAYRLLPLMRQAIGYIAHQAVRNRGTTVGSLVNADPAAEMPGVLSLLSGAVALTATAGSRTVAAAEFFLDPLTSAARSDELAVEAVFPVPPKGTGSAWLEVGRRRNDVPVCGAGLLVGLEATGVVSRLRAVYLSVGPIPVVVDLTDAVIGQRWESADWEAAALLAADTVRPRDDVHASAAYRRHLVQVLTVRAGHAAAAHGAGSVY